MNILSLCPLLGLYIWGSLENMCSTIENMWYHARICKPQNQKLGILQFVENPKKEIGRSPSNAND
jgi:hypothetical protein